MADGALRSDRLEAAPGAGQVFAFPFTQRPNQVRYRPFIGDRSKQQCGLAADGGIGNGQQTGQGFDHLRELVADDLLICAIHGLWVLKFCDEAADVWTFSPRRPVEAGKQALVHN